MKKCNKCKLEKPVTEFHMDKRSKDGFQAYCRSCAKAYFKAWMDNMKASGESIHVESKVCGDCSLEKPRSQFGRHSTRKDKLNSYCKPCWRIRCAKAIRKFNEKKKK
jgi:hypothetical protein